jgi:predicted component of type VI protein secretion system
MEVKLKVTDGKHAGQEIPVPGPKFIIGRDEDCQLRPGSDAVSRHHCVILIDETYVGVRDFGSKNGTYINGERIVGEQEIKPGDRLKVGPLEFELVVNHKLGGKKRPAVHGLKEAAARTAEARPSGDIDVTQWLAPEPGSKATSTSETQQLSAVDTSSMPAPIELPPAPAASANPDGSAHSEKKIIGKLPQQPKVTGKDSRDAAALMLEQLRKRR